MNVWFQVGGDECLRWWTSEVMNVWGDECLRWWTSGWWMSDNRVMNVGQSSADWTLIYLEKGSISSGQALGTWDKCSIMLADFHFDWQWHQHIVIDWCWLMTVGADWWWLMQIDADVTLETVTPASYRRRSVPTSLGRPFFTFYCRALCCCCLSRGPRGYCLSIHRVCCGSRGYCLSSHRACCGPRGLGCRVDHLALVQRDGCVHLRQ